MSTKKEAMQGNGPPDNPEPMDIAKVIAANLRRIRESQGISVNRLAQMVGVRLNTIQAIERGTTRKSKFLPDIARVLNVPIGEIDPTQSEQRPLSVVTDRRQIAEGVDDLPLYSSVEAGDGALVMSDQPYKLIERPTALFGVRDAYAILVIGDSMLPVLRPGYKVQVDPHLPPRRDDLCVFVDDREGAFKATVKEYIGQTDDAWKVKRYSPKEETFLLKKREWRRCHVVVGVVFR